MVIGLIMSVVGALSPDMFAAQNAGDARGFGANTTEETLTTLRTTDGQAFARVSVLWVEVDGRRVTEDAWGTGEVDEIRFKVGVKDVDALALAVGDKVVELHPTDIITVRTFRGDFSYRGVGTALATVQLQGTVKTTVLKEGDITNRVLTQAGDLDLAGVRQANTRPGDESKVAYVVLTTGEKVDTVAVEDGGARFYTEEAATAAEAKAEPGNLLAKWVKVENKLVREYTWGEGTLRKVEFEPAEGSSKSVVLAFNGEVAEIAAGERVVIEDFVGEYLIYQVSGDMMRVRLDGYAARFNTGAALAIPQFGGDGAPLANFEYTPISPKTTDTIRFTDLSEDDGGLVMFQRWDFGDGHVGVLKDPTHRYAKPGTYEVKLNVTDNDLQWTEVSRTIIVRNAEPVPDFDFSPKVVTTNTLVTFTDNSFDSDGRVASLHWDFGDGDTGVGRNAAHRYTRGGNVTVTLTATDELGASASISKVIIVRNAPPTAGFTFSGERRTLEPIQFMDNSSDTDGHLVAWNWSFGDGKFGAGSAPVHSYEAPGLYTVTLTATDDKGDSDTVSTNILIMNRPPFADFSYTPAGEPANVPITFTSTSTDVDGRVILAVWDFGDGSAPTRGNVVTHTFPRAGVYTVTLNVTDNTLGTDEVNATVEVGNSAPRANFGVTPSPGFRRMDITFSDASVDPDGDAIVNWTWDLGDGTPAFGRVVRHQYMTLGQKTVTLTVTDSQGTQASVSRLVHVLNRPPTFSVSFAPEVPRAGENITFTAEGIDPDLPGSEIQFDWTFSDGTVRRGVSVEHNFSTAGNFSVLVRARDVDGGLSAPYVRSIAVRHAIPQVNFTWSPPVPLKDQPVQFTDLTVTTPGAPVSKWEWSFDGDNPSLVSDQRHPEFTYGRNGTFNVTLRVEDVHGEVNILTKPIFINLRPDVRFVAPGGPIQLGQRLDFEDRSEDLDGGIVEWRWEFGDGNTSSETHPSLEAGYLRPGTYRVNLTVVDDHGATNTTFKDLNVLDHAPTADWDVSVLGGAPFERGATFVFDGSPSFDEDGQPIEAWDWTFFDDGTRANTSETTHIYNASGRHAVGLRVSAANKTSPITSDSHRFVDVAANHSVVLRITASLPGEREADLSRPEYSSVVRVAGVVKPYPVEHDDKALLITVPKEDWVHNTRVNVRLAAAFLVGTNEQDALLRDDVHIIHMHFALRMGTVSGIVPYPGVNDTIFEAMLPDVFPSNRNHTGEPLYIDMFESPRGTGFVRFTDGTVASFINVTVEARYVPFRFVQPIRDGIAVSELNNNNVLGWCPVDFLKTVANGTFEWEFDGQSGCILNSLNGGTYPLGRWEVRVRPELDPQNPSAPRAVYVDPTGGILLGALGTLA